MQQAKPRNGSVTVVIAGELDHFAAPQIRRKLDEMLQDPDITHLVLDLENLTFMDSSGIGVLLGRLRALQMRIAGQDGCGVRFGLIEQDFEQPEQERLHEPGPA